MAILAARQGGGWHTDQLCRALAARGHEGRVLPYEGLVSRFGGTGPAFASAGEDLTSCGAVLARIIPAGSLEQIIVRVDALHALEERGIPVINSPRAIERTVDKLWTTALLAHAARPGGSPTWRAAAGREPSRCRRRGSSRRWPPPRRSARTTPASISCPRVTARRT